MGKRHARVLGGQAEFDVVGVFDVHPERASAAAELAQTSTLSCEEDALAQAELVVVATPIAAHAPAITRALAAGRGLFVEKPLCARAQEATWIAERAERDGVGLWVGHSERFNPVIVALRATVAPDSIRSIALRRMAPPPQRQTGHGALLDLGVHDLDLVAFLTASPCELRRARSIPGRRADEAARVDVVTASGALAHVHVDRTARERKRMLVLHTEEDVFHGDLLRPRLVRTSLRTGETCEVPLDATEPLVAQARALAAALSGAPSACATGADGARAVVLAERASGRAENLSLFDPS